MCVGLFCVQDTRRALKEQNSKKKAHQVRISLQALGTDNQQGRPFLYTGVSAEN